MSQECIEGAATKGVSAHIAGDSQLDIPPPQRSNAPLIWTIVGCTVAIIVVIVIAISVQQANRRYDRIEAQWPGCGNAPTSELASCKAESVRQRLGY